MTDFDTWDEWANDALDWMDNDTYDQCSVSEKRAFDDFLIRRRSPKVDDLSGRALFCATCGTYIATPDTYSPMVALCEDCCPIPERKP